MRNKKAKQLRKEVGYNPNTDRTNEMDYDLENYSESFAVEDGINLDGTPAYKVMTVNKGTLTLQDNKRKEYKDLKKEVA